MVLFLFFAVFSSFCLPIQVFPVSSELQIWKMRNFFDRAPKGILLTVGGDRAFKSAALFEGIEHLIVVDNAIEINHFNRINYELLKADNKEDYRNLRWEDDLEVWKKTSEILTEEDFVWWEENVRNINHYDVPEKLNQGLPPCPSFKIKEKILVIYNHTQALKDKFDRSVHTFLMNVTWQDIQSYTNSTESLLTEEEFENFKKERDDKDSLLVKTITYHLSSFNLNEVLDYRLGSYLYNDTFYDRIHQLVMEKKIIFLNLDLKEESTIEVIISEIEKTQKKLAVVDLNNCYLYNYMGEEKYRFAVNAFMPWGTNDSILIAMSNYTSYLSSQFSIYVGFTFENIQSWSKDLFFNSFINDIPSHLRILLDGRLYIEKDPLPYQHLLVSSD